MSYLNFFSKVGEIKPLCDAFHALYGNPLLSTREEAEVIYRKRKLFKHIIGIMDYNGAKMELWSVDQDIIKIEYSFSGVNNFSLIINFNHVLENYDVRIEYSKISAEKLSNFIESVLDPL